MAMIYCRECGAKHSDKATQCPKCGYSCNPVNWPKSALVYTLLAFFLGWLGVHKFYAGKTGQGIAMLLMGTVGWILLAIPVIIVGIWAFVDFIIGLCNLNTPEKLFAK